MVTTGAEGGAVSPPAADGEYGTPRERRGWYMYDWANSAFSTTVVTLFAGPYLIAIAREAADADGRIHPFGLTLRPGSLFNIIVPLSVILTVVVLPVVGAIADRSPHKRRLMAVFAYLGATATVGMVFVTGDRYMLGALLFILANIAFGASVVVYNSFLPQIAGPERRDSVSSIGWAIGYLGGGVLLLLNLVAVFKRDAFGISEGDAARYSIVSAGLWWALFTVIPLRTLKDRPPVEGVPRGRSAVVDGFVQLRGTLRDLRRYPLTLFFLVTFLIYNDGIQTVIYSAGVYASEELGLSDTVRVGTILMVQFVAFGGALALGWLAKRIGAKRSILLTLAAWAVLLVIAYLLPGGNAWPFIVLGGVIGLVLGGSQALSRSLFSQLIPAGKEGEYFGFYEISDKGTSWIGGIIFAVAYEVTGSYRVAIISLVAFFVVGFVMLAAVPIRRAIVEAGNTPPRVV